LAEAVYNAMYPNSASDVHLARIGEITNIAPNAATKSQAVVYLAGTDTTLIPADSLISVINTNVQFKLLANVTLSGSNFPVIGLTRIGTTVTANATGHAQPVGAYVFINDAVQPEYNGLQIVTVVVDANNFEYEINTAPVTPATGSITADPTTSGTVESVDTGPVQALSHTLSQIVTPVTGWTQAANFLDAILGNNDETDAAFRARRILALFALGGGTINAIIGEILKVQNVTQVNLIENTDDVPDIDGRPGHSIEAIVQGGLDQDIFDAVFRKAAGIETFGPVSGTVLDSTGKAHTMNFSRPGTVPIWLELDLTVTGDYPVDGSNQVVDGVLGYGEGLTIGDDVIVFPSLISSFAGVPGITDITVRIGITASPTLDDNIIIGGSDLAVFDSSRITIVTI